MNELNDKSQTEPSQSRRPRELIRISFGEVVFEQRTLIGITQAEAARKAGVSSGYLSELENGKRFPPPRRTALCIARAIGMDQEKARELAVLALRERGCERSDRDLPPEILDLINCIKCHAFSLRPRFVRGLRAKIMETVM